MAGQLALLLQLFGCFDGIVGENAICTGTFEGEQAFKDNFVACNRIKAIRAMETTK